MTSLAFALIGCFLASFGARDQVLVTRLRAALGPSPGLLFVALASAIATAFVAAWAGAWFSAMLSESAATMFVALALFFAGAELAWPNRLSNLEEPTRSLGAIALVLLARQLTDGSRFLVCAIAAATASPSLAGLGGAVGGAGAIALAWTMGADLEARLPLRALRWILAALLIVTAVVLGLSARGLVG